MSKKTISKKIPPKIATKQVEDITLISDPEEENVKRWYIKQYLHQLEQNKNIIPVKIAEKIRSDITLDNIWDTGVLDMLKMTNLNSIGMVEPVDYICVVQRATIKSLNTTVNYGYLYYKYKDTSTEWKKEESNGIFSGDSSVRPHFICVSPSFLSQDGEYRPRIYSPYRYKQLISEPKIYDPLRNFIIHKIEKHKIEFSNEFYYPLIDVRKKWEKEIETNYVDTGYPINLFILYWLGEIEKIMNDMEENHINFKFKHIFFSDIKEDVKFYKELKKILEPDELRYYTNIIHSYTVAIQGKNYGERTGKKPSYVYWGVHSPPKIRVLLGQKLRPLNIAEAQNPENIKFDPWREQYLSRKVNNLLLNRITHGVPYGLFWFYIKNTHTGLFDNPVQDEKIKYSERGYLIVNKLREIQRLTFESDTDEYINENFEHLHNEINPDVEFTKDKLMISNVSLGVFSHNVGHTFYDLPKLMNSSQCLKASGNMLKDGTLFKKYLFELTFTLMGLNKLSGVVHSDLHLNNATIHFQDIEFVEDFTKEKLVAIYGVDNYWFQIPARQARAYIIDFSRSTVNPKIIKKDSVFKDKKEEKEFIEEQNKRIFYKLKSLVPSLIDTYDDIIMKLITSYFDKIYKLYTIVDMYDLCSKLKVYFKSNKKFGIHDSVFDFLDKIIKIGDHYLNTVFLNLIQNPETVFEWPNLKILKECFTDFLIDSNKKIPDEVRVINYYCLNFDPVFDINDLDKYPDYLNYVKGIQHNKKEYMISDYQKKTIKRYEDYRKIKFGMIEYIAERHRKKYQ
jgi:hypothetical protein